MELQLQKPSDEIISGAVLPSVTVQEGARLGITVLSEEDILNELGFNTAQRALLLSKFQNFSSVVKKEAFEARIHDHPLILERNAGLELNDAVSVNKEARILGEAIFWAYLAEYDAGVCENIVEFRALSHEQYKIMENKVETFLQNDLFHETTPCFQILQEAKKNVAKGLQTEFLHGLLDPFVRCYDDVSHQNIIERIEAWFDRLTYHRTPGFAELGLTPKEERILDGVRQQAAPEAEVQYSSNMADGCKRINLLLDTLQDTPNTLIDSLFKEIRKCSAIDEATFARILSTCSKSIRWGRTNDQELMKNTHDQMRKRGMGDWGQGKEWHSFQLPVLLEALLKVSEVAAPDFSSRFAKRIEEALRISMVRKDGDTWKDDYLSDQRRYISALLVEKDALAK